MKFVWEEKDIIGGKRVGKTNCESYKICYRYTVDQGTIYGLCSSRDGSIVKEGSKMHLAQLLTSIEYGPEELI